MKSRWSIIKKFSLIFFFCYFFLYANSSQFVLSFLVEPIWQLIIPWFAETIGHPEPITVFTNGSGDTTYNYYQVLFFAVFSVVLTLIVTIIDRKRANYRTLLSYLTLLLRYYLAFQMINYGLAKLYYMQFSFPSAARLDQELGDFSPMGLLWTFMGYSKGYTMFTGAMELLGGLLLFHRKTTTLGALTSFGVMLNVMMLNYCYDVPVKLLSTHLVIMSLFIILLDGNRLFRFFISNQAIQTHTLKGIIPTKFEGIKNLIKWPIILFYLAFSLYQANNNSKKWGPNAPKPPLYGKHIVDKFEIHRDTLVFDSIPDVNRWGTFYQKWTTFASMKTGAGENNYINIQPDTSENNFLILKKTTSTEWDTLRYESMDSIRYRVYGVFENDSLEMIFRYEDINDRLLVKRGFNWINEYPFNR